VVGWGMHSPQCPMPFPPDQTPSNSIHVNARVQVLSEGEVRVVVVAGTPVTRFACGDQAGEAHAMAMLVTGGFANPTQVQRAFGCSRQTVYRVVARYDEGGVAALVHGKRGPKGPSKLGAAAVRRMIALKRKGEGNRPIAAKLRVTESAVRAALKRAGWQQPGRVAQQPLPLVTKAEAAVVGAVDAAETTGTPVDDVSSAAGDEAGTSAAVVAAPQGAAGTPVPVTLDTDPRDRSVDRLMARLGLLEDAVPLFGSQRNVAGAGVLLAVPALVHSGVFEAAREVYGSLGAAFYGLRNVVLALLMMALLRVKRAEGLRHTNPATLGGVLGLDRAPEVKTLRGKVAVLAQRGRSEEFMRRLAQRRVEAQSEAMGFLYVDGHVRVYSGKHDLPKAHVTRMRLSMPATVDHWVNDQEGDPLFVVTATPTSFLTKEFPAVLGEVRGLVGERRVTVVFDRGGWSPKLFDQMVRDGFDVVTYRKGRYRKVRRDKFEEHKAEFGGRSVKYMLAERPLKLLRGELSAREVVRLSDDGKHQTSIVTTRKDLPVIEVAYRMFERWRQENFFKYMGEQFALDGLVSYGVEAADAERMVPNPERTKLERELKKARADLAACERAYGAAAASNEEARRRTMRGFKIAHGDIGKVLRASKQRVDDLAKRAHALPRRVTAQQAAKGEPVVRLRTEAKRLTDVLKMVAYQAETALVRLTAPHYKRIDDEGRALIASTLRSHADIETVGDELRVTLEPGASPNRTRAIACLCEQLNATQTTFPGSTLKLRFAVREA